MTQDGDDREDGEKAVRTVLSSSSAKLVSFAIKSSSLCLHVGTFLGGLAIDAAHTTTLTGFEVSRALCEGVLYRAGDRAAEGSVGELGRLEAAGILERSIATLHSTITNISFAASTGFYFSSTLLHTAGYFSQTLLLALDNIFGTTDSSRAIASIITMVQSEFQNPATGRAGEKVSVGDLLLGMVGFAFVQDWCKTITDAETQEGIYEEVLFDVVIWSDGRRADVVTEEGNTNQNSAGTANAVSNNVAKTVEERRVSEDSNVDSPEMTLKRKIMKSLTADSSVSITTQTTSTKTITVNISGGFCEADLSPPPGIEIIEKNELVNESRNPNGTVEGCSSGEFKTKHRVVYRVTHNKIREISIDSTKSGKNAEEAIELSDEEALPAILEKNADFTTDLPSLKDNAAVEIGEATSRKRNKLTPASVKSLDSSHSQELKHTKTTGRSSLPVLKVSDNLANQKRFRKPPGVLPPSTKTKPERPLPSMSEKKGSFRNVIRKSNTLSRMWPGSKETPSDVSSSKSASKPSWSSSQSQIPGPQRRPSTHISHETPRPPQRGNPNYFTSRDLGSMQAVDRSQSRTSYYSIHESTVSQTDTYSINTADMRPDSPTAFRSTAHNTMSNESGSSVKHHSKSYSYEPSVFTLKNESSQSLVLVKPQTSVVGNSQFVRNISRFARFSSASYGSYFLRVMGIANPVSSLTREDTQHHLEHHSFSSHAQLPPDTILLSSFHDPQGGTDSTGKTNTNVSMCHFVSLDHDSKAVVLTIRGTLGFEDVLSDMACDYDELIFRDQKYLVHRGVHASARKLLDGGVMVTIASALKEHPHYEFVLNGHSLGGAVASLLAILVSEPSGDPASTAFVLKPDKSTVLSDHSVPVHVYAYGPPATVCPSLRRATRGLITTIVNGMDIVPSLSLGVLHDFQAVALAFQTDNSGIKLALCKRLFRDKWYAKANPDTDEDQRWAYSCLKALRASMISSKLLPPGDVYIIETTPVLRQDAFVQRESNGKPAMRSVLKYVRNVERRFSEIKFSGSMLLDHSPGRYEKSLDALAKGILT